MQDWEIVPANAWRQGWPEQAISVRPFGTVVVLAVAVGVALTMTQTRRLHIERRRMLSFIYFVVLGGFIGGHLLDIVFYAPELLAEQPLQLLAIAEGQSSFGGFVGATAGAFLFRRWCGGAILPLAEIVASAFPSAWVVGRIACFLVHDHPGIRSDLWFAVAYPAGGRLDLGLLEAVAVAPLAVAFLAVRRRPMSLGFYVATTCLYYAPLRFGLDFLRRFDTISSDRRCLELTPAQWGCALLVGVGLYFSTRKRNPFVAQSGVGVSG
jgi:phosphatidylglycerol:prolipoprotein diacylglycerol transferase